MMLLICHLGGIGGRSESSERMSSGLMSCVRENSPPIDNGVEQTSGPFSLPVSHSTSFSPNSRQRDTHYSDSASSLAANNLPVEVDVSNAEATATPNTDNKRRRFQPFRNIRRLFRRRTISASVHEKPRPTEHGQKYNDHRGTSTATARVIRNKENDKYKITTEKEEKEQTASSPCSPLTHQQFEQSFSSQTSTLPKSNCCDGTNPINNIVKLLDNPTACARCHNQPVNSAEEEAEEDVMYATTSRPSGSQTLPISFVMYQNNNSNKFQVLPTVINREFSNDVHSVAENFQRNSSQESEVDSKCKNDANDITDNQCTLSDEPLLDSEYSQEPLSQSHDSVFSESATASSFSSVLKAELADVLRKRRNRPDASDEDLGLPHSPSSPRRLNDSQSHPIHTLSNFDSNTESCDDIFCASTANNSYDGVESLEERSKTAKLTNGRYCHRAAQIHVSAINSNKRHTISSSAFQEIADELDGPRLSHDGAKHKMALRQKKKAPSRLQRRTLDTSIPERSENFVKIPATRAFFEDSKIKTQTLPVTANPKEMTTEYSSSTVPSLNNTTGAANLAQFYRKRTRDQIVTPHMESMPLPAYNVRTITTKAGPSSQSAKTELSVSKDNQIENAFLRTVAMRNSYRKDEDENDSHAKKLHMSSSNYEVTTRKSNTEIYSNDNKTGIVGILNNVKMMTTEAKATPTKAKSGPEARQRYAPISINFPENDTTTSMSTCQHVIREQKEKERLKSTAVIKHIVSAQQSPREVNDLNFERNPRTVNMNSYKQKSYSVYEPDGHAATRFMETNEEKDLRKPVEKARSFRLSNDSGNMPSLPDLSGKEVESCYFSKSSPTQDKCVSLGFEINDNNLMKRASTVTTKSQMKITPTHTSKSAMDLSSRVLVPQVTQNSNSNRDITEIEQNIDMIVKSSPFISIVERTVESKSSKSSKSSEDLTRSTKIRPNRLSLKLDSSENILNLMPIPYKDKQRQSVPMFKQEHIDNAPKRSISQQDKINANLPEFLKIQLTPIDLADKTTEHIVLAKNMKSPVVKEASPAPSTSSNGTTTTSINSDSRDGSISPICKSNVKLNKRHDSNESIEIKEQTSPPTQIVEAINGDARAIVTNFLARHSLKTEPQTASTPTTPTKQAVHNLKSFSLQERRRMFLNEDQQKTDKKVDELRTERKKSISEEVLLRKEKTPTTSPTTPTVKTKIEILKKVVEKTKERQETKTFLKSPTKSTTALVKSESTTGFTTETKPRMPKPATASVESKPETKTETATVVLRKKTAPSHLPIAGKLQLASTPHKINSRNDEPELMKVFARRSLKVKDEDINNLNEKIQTNNRRTICVAATQGMDSDKENQSASIERLNKLMQLAASREENEDNNNNNNEKKSLAAEKNNNNFISTPLSPTKVISPTHEHNKLNNNASSEYRGYEEANSKAKVENLDTNNGNANQNGVNKKTIVTGKMQAMQERATSMGEFKNINQRRAEWEQRAKGVKN